MSQGTPAGRRSTNAWRHSLLGLARSKLGLARASPWLRAPLLLLRYPGLLLAIAIATVILALAGASSPLFLSSAGNASLAEGLRSTCPWVAGVQIRAPGPLFGHTFTGAPATTRFVQTQQRIASIGRSIPHTAPLELQIVGTAMQASAPRRAKEVAIRLYTRGRALANVQKMEIGTGPGVWLPHTVARSLRLGAGDTLRLASADGKVTVPVAGVYRDLATVSRSPFWCAQDHLIYPLSGFANYIPPPLVLADQDTFYSLGTKLGDRGATFTWEIPVVAEGLTLPEARRVDAAMQGQNNGLREAVIGFGSTVSIDSSFDFIVERANATVAALRSSVWTVSLAGRLVALIVIAGAGVYWVHRRRTEAGLLSARGTGPVALGTKALLETLPVAILGSALGWLAGIWLVKALGPSALLDGGAQASALRQVAWTSAVGVLFLAAVAGAAARRDSEPSEARGRRSLAGAPWEVAVLVLAAASLYEFLNSSPPSTADITHPLKVDVLVLLFPILFVAGAAGLAARGLKALLPRLRSRGDSWRPSAYLAGRRLAGSPRIVLALLTATALSIGILSYAGALATSVRATTDAKARLFAGSDLNVTVASDVSVPPSIAARATKVTFVDRASFTSDQTGVEVIGVDRATFPRAAFWDPSFAGEPLDGLLAKLTPPAGPAAPLPVIAAGPSVGRVRDTLAFRFGATRVPIRIVASVRAFPRLSPSEPLLVADRAALETKGVGGVTEVWVKGDSRSALRALTAGDTQIIATTSADEVKQQQSFASLSWTFGFLQALGVMAGLIVLGGILLYLEARQRTRAISFAMASRMGLSRRAHRSSIAFELGTLLALGCLVGITLAWIAARVVYGKLDPLPQLPPGPLFRLPLAAFALTALALLASAWAGAWRVQRAAERVHVSEVMRVAG